MFEKFLIGFKKSIIFLPYNNEDIWSSVLLWTLETLVLIVEQPKGQRFRPALEAWFYSVYCKRGIEVNLESNT